VIEFKVTPRGIEPRFPA